MLRRGVFRRIVAAMLGVLIGAASVQPVWADSPVPEDHVAATVAAMTAGAALTVADAPADTDDGCAGLCLCMCNCIHAQPVIAPAPAEPVSPEHGATRVFTSLPAAAADAPPEPHLRPPLG
jgi:hypothetical protein